MTVLNGRQRRQARIAAAMALLALAGCADNAPAPDAAPHLLNVKMEPQGSVRPDQARRLAALMAEEARRQKLETPGGERLDGVVDAGRAGDGLYLVTVIDVSNGKGKRLHRIVDDSLRPKQTLTDSDLLSIASSAIKKLALWHAASRDETGGIRESAPFDVAELGPDDEIATANIAAILTAKPRFEIAMGPAPGDGAAALKSALEDELSRMSPAGDTGRYLVRGEVAVSSTDTGDAGVAIRWQVTAAGGQSIGIVTQTRAAAPSRIASYWGDLAKAAAEPAAKGILAMLKPAPRLPGNAS